jgi:phage terminase large subunit-like protein
MLLTDPGGWHYLDHRGVYPGLEAMTVTLPDNWRTWDPARKKKLLRRLSAERARQRMRGWRQFARYKQLPPDDPRHGYEQTIGDQFASACQCHRGEHRWTPDLEWLIWLIMSGRGFGKTWTGASWLAEQARANPNSAWACIAPTFSDARRICIEGSTGLLTALGKDDVISYRRNDLEIELANGAIIYGFSADRPDRVRGSNLWGAWCDELGSWRYEATWHEGLMPALRIGERPRVVVTTTPRGTKLLRELAGRGDSTVHITQGSTWENAKNLSKVALQELKRRYGGTRIGRQELEGELISDVEGALWRRAWIEADRIGTRTVGNLVELPVLPTMRRIVVGIDPATTSKDASALTGIIVVGLGTDGHLYILADVSGKMTPGKAMRRAIAAYYEWEADRIVCEVNNGGDFVEELVRTLDENVPYRSVHASRGKQVRAEPISSIYEQHRAHHVGTFPELEDQLCTWTPLDPESPDRLDALVWACTELSANVDWTTMYGPAYTCPTCDKLSILIATRPACPYCREPIDPDLLAQVAA